MLARKLPTELVPSRETKLLAKSEDHQAVRVTFAWNLPKAVFWPIVPHLLDCGIGWARSGWNWASRACEESWNQFPLIHRLSVIMIMIMNTKAKNLIWQISGSSTLMLWVPKARLEPELGHSWANWFELLNRKTWKIGKMGKLGKMEKWEFM